MPGVRVYVLKHGLLYPLDGGTPIAPAGGIIGPTPPPPSPGGTGMLVGASVGQGIGTDFDPTLAAHAGPWTVARRYNSGAIGTTWATDPSGCGTDVGKRATVWSAKPNLAAMASGALDAAVTAFVESIPDSHVCFLEIWHEGDVKLRKGQLTLSQLNAAKARFYKLVRDVGKPHVYTTLILSNWSVIGGVTVGLPSDFWVGGDYGDDDQLIDVVGWDGYQESNTVHTGAYEWAGCVSFANSHGVAWGIGEIGLGGAVTDFSAGASWMSTQAAYAAATPSGPHGCCAYMTWFNTNVGGVTPTPSGQSGLITASGVISTANLKLPTTFVL